MSSAVPDERTATYRAGPEPRIGCPDLGFDGSGNRACDDQLADPLGVGLKLRHVGVIHANDDRLDSVQDAALQQKLFIGACRYDESRRNADPGPDEPGQTRTLAAHGAVVARIDVFELKRPAHELRP